MGKADYYIKEGDSAPFLTVTAVDENGAPIPLTAAIEAKFFMTKPPGREIKIDGKSAEILAPVADGRMRYRWENDGSDTDTPGNYDAEFEVLWSDGTRTTFPNFRYLQVQVDRSVDTSD